jgi:predicted HTH domain antitoxin
MDNEEEHGLLSYWYRAMTQERIDTASTISIDIPREILHVTRMSPEELRRELAISLFQQQKLSFGKARELAGMTAWTFQQLLGSRGIVAHYDVEDYEEDLETLKELGRV